jgi:hypothetical protein
MIIQHTAYTVIATVHQLGFQGNSRFRKGFFKKWLCGVGGMMYRVVQKYIYLNIFK